MSPSPLDFDFARGRRPPPLPRWAWLALVGAFVVSSAWLVSEWMELRSLERQLVEAKARLAERQGAASAPYQPPPYYEDAMAAARMLQFPITRPLDELEQCVEGSVQIERILLNQPDSQGARSAVATVVLKYEAPSDLAQLIDCLNSGLPPMPWRLSQMRRIIDVAAPAPAASAPESYVATLLRDADT